MTNTTDTYWSASGMSLNTYAHNIETLGGNRFSPPARRGSDIKVPHRVGEVWVPKIVDSRTITLAMWVRGWTDDNARGTNPDRKFMENWERLVAALWQPDVQIPLQKRFYVGDVIRSATAQAEFVGGLEPTMTGRNGAKFTVDLKLADPYFYDDVYTNFTIANGDSTIVLPGTAETRNIRVTINGARNNYKLQTLTPKAIQFEYLANLNSGSSAMIDVMNSEATATPSGAPSYDASALVEHAGAPHWFALAPGSNTLRQPNTGSGAVQLQGKGAWI